MEEYVARASQCHLQLPGTPKLTWKTVDVEADYRQLKPGEFFNHFQQNRCITTKAGLAQILAQHAMSSGVDVDSFFPRCYDAAQKTDREDFVLDFRRSAVLRIVLLHNRLCREQKQRLGAAGYSCNRDLLKASERILRRWYYDLDPDHLDEDEAHEVLDDLAEETWDALMLYSDLTQVHLCSQSTEKGPVRVPKRRFARPAGGELEGKKTECDVEAKTTHWRSAELNEWPEFHSHTWGQLDEEGQTALDELLDRLEKLFPQWSLQGGWSGRNVWIVKPGTNSKGSGIECMSSLPDLLHHCDRMPNRLVQKYIERPLLLFSGRKFDIRQWVLVRSVAPLKVFFFSECYLRLCNGMYDLGDLRDRERHISNWQVNKHGRNVVDGAVVSLSDFCSELRELTGREDFWEEELLPSVKRIVIEVLRAAEGRLCHRAESFELFGFDIMVDENMRPWLLEVNLSPGCESRTPFLERMLERMAQRLVEVAVLGLEEPDGEKPDWIKICDDGADKSPASLAVVEAAKRAADPMRPSAADLAVQGKPLRAPKKRRAGGSESPHSNSPRQRGKQEEAGKKSTGPTPSAGQLKSNINSEKEKSPGHAKAISSNTEGLSPGEAGQDYDEDFEDDDEEDQEDREKGVSFDKLAKDASLSVSTSPQRKGTGFVNVGDLPDTDDEDEEEKEATRAVNFDKSAKDNNTISLQSQQRKGTGFVNVGDIPDTDEEEEGEEDDEPKKEVAFDQSAKDNSPDDWTSSQRKGTGFVSIGDIPDTDSEDEDAKTANSVAFDKSAKDTSTPSSQTPQRKGTGFVNVGDIPDTDEEEDEEAKKGVAFDKSAKDKSPSDWSSPQRKGTGFVNVGDIPDTESEDEDEGETSKAVAFDKSAKDQSTTSSQSPQRQGTGFVNVGDIPDSDDEELAKEVTFDKSVKNGPGSTTFTAKRQATGHVKVEDIPSSDDEDFET